MAVVWLNVVKEMVKLAEVTTRVIYRYLSDYAGSRCNRITRRWTDESPHIEPPSLALERARSGGLEFLRCYGSKLKKTGRSLSNTILTYTTYGLLGPRFSPGSGYRDRLRPADSLHLRKGYLQLTDARITSQVGALLYNCIDNQPRPIALDV